jgi:O-antigen ligase
MMGKALDDSARFLNISYCCGGLPTAASLGHAGYMAGNETAVFFAALALAGLETSRRWRVFYTFAMILASLAILLSGTRSAILAIAAGILITWGLCGSFSLQRILAFLLALAVFSVIVLSPQGSQVRERMKHWTEANPGGPRAMVWLDTAKLVAAHPVMGSGPEAFPIVFAPCGSKALAQRFPDVRHESPHNIFLDAAVSQGIPVRCCCCSASSLPVGARLKRRFQIGSSRERYFRA